MKKGITEEVESPKLSKKDIQLLLQQSFAEIGIIGVQFIPRMEEAISIGSQERQKLLDELAKLVPCVPYSGVVLSENGLYITFDTQGNKSSEELLKILQDSNAYKKLGEVKINFVDYNRNLGDHPDTVAIAAAIKDDSKEMSLGLAAFDSDRKLNEQAPASCACCASAIRSMNANGYKISVSSSTPLNFPSNKNYIIPPIIANDPALMDKYLTNVMMSLDRVQQKINSTSERDLYVQYYARDEIRRIMQNSSLSSSEQNEQINSLKDELSVEYDKKTGGYKKFEADLKKFNETVQNSISYLPSLCSNDLKQNLAQRRTELKENLSKNGIDLDKQSLHKELRDNAHEIQKIWSNIQSSDSNIESLKKQIKEIDRAIVNEKVVEASLEKYNSILDDLQKQLDNRKAEIEKGLGPVPTKKSERGAYDKKLSTELKTDKKIIELNSKIRSQEDLIKKYIDQNSNSLSVQKARYERQNRLIESLENQKKVGSGLRVELKKLENQAKKLEELRKISLFLPSQEQVESPGLGHAAKVQRNDEILRKLQQAQIQNIANGAQYGPDDFNVLLQNVPIANNALKLSNFLAEAKQNDTIILNVNTISSNFENDRNTHWVGLIVDRENKAVVCVDPLGRKVGKDIQQIISDNTGYKIEELYNTKVRPQHAEVVGKKDEAFLEGNDRDCGTFLVHALERFQQMQNPVDAYKSLLNEVKDVTDVERSRQYGLSIRQEHAKKVDVIYKNINDNNHLKHSNKLMLSDTDTQYNLKEAVLAINEDYVLINKLNREAVITADIDLKSVDIIPKVNKTDVGKVEFLPEQNHSRDHESNTKSLIADIESGKIGSDTVIGVERKNYGNNLGVPDMIMLANILEHNSKNPSKKLNIPKGLENNSLIYHDAMLYSTAKEHGIKVIGLEGRNLEHGKDSPLYNKNREQYMVDVINEVRNKGYNVIVHVGSAHVANLEKGIKEASTKETKGLSGIPRHLIDRAKEIGTSVGTSKTGGTHGGISNIHAQREKRSLTI